MKKKSRRWKWKSKTKFDLLNDLMSDKWWRMNKNKYKIKLANIKSYKIIYYN
jgi:hypothetical protein